MCEHQQSPGSGVGAGQVPGEAEVRGGDSAGAGGSNTSWCHHWSTDQPITAQQGVSDGGELSESWSEAGGGRRSQSCVPTPLSAHHPDQCYPGDAGVSRRGVWSRGQRGHIQD